ncbi:hypothetical protein V2A60_000284 [Cordyceps javanica]|uniref:Uncharacterized protein n=1 Tax=Cordyceps javanica TaxID=43265 RepID=A0A545W2V7_9HYPO|nr:hypothetical protein IF1G_04309 [Cordyceps javanica]TQW08319.1 hypothetical protein IF2G_04195 [Cordyceps javanica]
MVDNEAGVAVVETGSLDINNLADHSAWLYVAMESEERLLSKKDDPIAVALAAAANVGCGCAAALGTKKKNKSVVAGQRRPRTRLPTSPPPRRSPRLADDTTGGEPSRGGGDSPDTQQA